MWKGDLGMNNSQARQKQIEELKALRAELLARKNEDGESSSTSSQSQAMASVKKTYFEDHGHQESSSQHVDKVRENVYAHYQNDENDEMQDTESIDEHRALTRGR